MLNNTLEKNPTTVLRFIRLLYDLNFGSYFWLFSLEIKTITLIYHLEQLIKLTPCFINIKFKVFYYLQLHALY